ncbi:hypothetical protein H6P81_012735 [Aristolochia fimbriata]|uniref:Uncharacterized protein n=1 Tax=Aristolochia fimbriata TaxID=158543 RepID=A0AAV7EGA4_ARIFI|nr:hypothetical protein H6P81_012735 [Aristolochia fimbriata]
MVQGIYTTAPTRVQGVENVLISWVCLSRPSDPLLICAPPLLQTIENPGNKRIEHSMSGGPHLVSRGSGGPHETDDQGESTVEIGTLMNTESGLARHQLIAFSQ